MQEVCHYGFHGQSLPRVVTRSSLILANFCYRLLFSHEINIFASKFSCTLWVFMNPCNDNCFFFPIKVKKYVFNVTGWCLAIVLAVSSLYGKYKTVREHNPHPFSPTQEIAYGILKRFAWSLAIAWVIFACQSGLGGKLTS